MPDINDILGINLPPEQPQTKRKIIEDLIQNLVFSIGQGYQAQAGARGSQARAAGIGAAIQGPMVLQQIRQQQANDAQDRAIKIAQLRQAALRGDQDQVLKLRDAINGSVAPEVTVPAAPMMPSGNNPDALQPQGTRQVPMPLPSFQYPTGGGQSFTLPPSTSAQQGQEMAANALRQQEQIKQEFAKPAVDIRPFGTNNSGLFDATNGKIVKPPDSAAKKPMTLRENMTIDGKGPVPVWTDDEQHFFTAAGQPIDGSRVGQYEKPAATPNPASADSSSYKFHIAELDKRAKPIDDAATRLSRLTDSIGQGTAQADALIAPELMTVMAGGMGSGLRINNAEIDRVHGGRPMIAQLQAKLRSWLGTDQKSAINFGPDERQAINDLVNIVGSKIRAKQEALTDTGSIISGEKTSDQQRRTALAALDKKLRDIDNPQGSVTPTGGGNNPAPVGTVLSDGRVKQADGTWRKP